MVIVIDPQIAGISGDMLLSALVDLGANKNKIISGIKIAEKFLPHSIISSIDFKKVKKSGVESTALFLKINEDVHERKGIELRKAVIDCADKVKLSQRGKNFAIACIDTLINSESKIHGISTTSVHFHEASSIDTLIDIIGVTIAIEDLGFFDEKVVCMPICVGSGHVTFSHGIMSNPASAVLEILKNSELMIKGSSDGDELTTPTGASILVNFATSFSESYPLMKIKSVGYGAGQKDFDNFSNVLKIVQGINSIHSHDTVKILETNVDDVSGEIIGNLINKIMKQGAKDISVYPGITKKGRPTNLISVICTETLMDKILDTLILETGTLGIRIFTSERFIVPRKIKTITMNLDGKSFSIRYKIFNLHQKTGFKIEFDDLIHISKSLNKPLRQVESLIRTEIQNRDT